MAVAKLLLLAHFLKLQTEKRKQGRAERDGPNSKYSLTRVCNSLCRVEDCNVAAPLHAVHFSKIERKRGTSVSVLTAIKRTGRGRELATIY